MRIFGKQVIFTEKVPILGDAGDIVLCNLSQYAVGIRSEMTLERSIHVGFLTDVQHFRTIIRVDGMGKWDSAYTPKQSSAATLSWVVTLAARA